MNAIALINSYYPDNNQLKSLLLFHSRQVCERTMLIIQQHPELTLDRALLYDGALLHDIGIYLTHAPSIFCYGKADYLLHGHLGAESLLREGYPALARICERHTGTGLTKEAILSRHLDIPAADYLPETLEEKAVCYADKFYSKSKPERIRNVDEAYHSLLPFGAEGAER